MSSDVQEASGTAFAAMLVVLALAVLGVDVWAFIGGMGPLPLWIWVTSVVFASLALVGAFVQFVYGILAKGPSADGHHPSRPSTR